MPHRDHHVHANFKARVCLQTALHKGREALGVEEKTVFVKCMVDALKLSHLHLAVAIPICLHFYW